MAERIYYRPHRSRLARDGTLTVPVLIYKGYSHSFADMEIPPTAEDYAFWRWVVGEARFARILDHLAVAQARAEFAAGRGGANPDGASPGT